MKSQRALRVTLIPPKILQNEMREQFESEANSFFRLCKMKSKYALRAKLIPPKTLQDEK